jgi:hypothetical protein
LASTDDGLTWGSASALSLSGKATALAMAADRHGVIHVVGVSGRLGSSNSALFSTSWRDNEWTPVDSLAFGAIETMPSLSSLDGDTLFLSWAQARRASTTVPASAPIGRYAYGSPECKESSR